MGTKRARIGTGAIQKEIGASRSISNQVYVGVVFDGFSLVFQAFFDLGGLKVAKTFQDAPRRAKMRPRRPQTPQDGSKLVPRGARKRPRCRQIRGKKRHKSDPKRNPFQISFLKGFRADFARFSDGFGKVLGMILEAWR